MNQNELRQIIKEEIQKYIHQYNNINENDLLEEEWKLLNELTLDLENIYKIDEKSSSKYIKSFYDNENRLNIMKAKNNNGFIEIKFYWLKEDNGKFIPTYEAPLNSTAKTFNTYLSLFLNYFINLGDNFILQPTDNIRQRLYKIAINKLLDKDNYKSFEKDNQIFIIKK